MLPILASFHGILWPFRSQRDVNAYCHREPDEQEDRSSEQNKGVSYSQRRLVTQNRHKTDILGILIFKTYNIVR